MKKIISMFCVVITLVFSISACGKSSAKRIKIPSFEEVIQKYEESGYDIPSEFRDNFEELSELSEKEKTESIIDSMKFKDYIDFVKDIRSADWYVGTRTNEDGLEDEVYQYNYELNSKESAKKLFEYLLDDAAEGKDAFERKDQRDCSSAVYCASESHSDYDAFGYTNFIFLSGKTVVQMKNVWDEYQNEGVRYDHKPQKMLEGFGLVITEDIIEEKEDKKESSAKKVTFEKIEKAFKKAGYSMPEEYAQEYEEQVSSLSDKELTQIVLEEFGFEEQKDDIKYANIFAGIRMRNVSGGELSDTVQLSFIEFKNKKSAKKSYELLVDDIEQDFDMSFVRTDGDRYSRILYRCPSAEDGYASEYGETKFLYWTDNIIVFMMNEWDDYQDAEINFDDKPQKLLETFGLTVKVSDKKVLLGKKRSAHNIVSAFEEAGYDVDITLKERTREEFSQRINYTYNISASRSKKGINDTITVKYIEFADEDTALEWYDDMFDEIFGEYSEESKMSGGVNGYVKAIYIADEENDYGETAIYTLNGKTIIIFNNDWDEYKDASIRFDHKPEKLFEELGI